MSLDDSQSLTNYDRALEEMHKEKPDVSKALKLLETSHEGGDARATYALASWYRHGREPVVVPDRDRAIELIKVAAAAGIPDALYDIAVSYENGEIGPPDPRRAFENFLRAALLGESQSILEVGRSYEHGLGVAVDREVALIWIERANELGVSE